MGRIFRITELPGISTEWGSGNAYRCAATRLPNICPLIDSSAPGSILRFAHPTRCALPKITGYPDYPESTMPGSLDDLIREPYEFIETQSFTILSRPDAKNVIERQTRRLWQREMPPGRRLLPWNRRLMNWSAVALPMASTTTVWWFADSLEEVGKSLAAARSKPTMAVSRPPWLI